VSEKVLGIIGVFRPSFMRQISETLFFTPDRTIIARAGSWGQGMMFGVVGTIAEIGIRTLKKIRKRNTVSYLWKMF